MMSEQLFIIGICGTFMGSLAVIAKQMGYQVSGCDQQVYPPMSTYLESQGINILPGFEEAYLKEIEADMIIVGNVAKRGMPIIEALLNSTLPYTSGPQWLYEHVLRKRWVLAVAGTHGKTSTASMLTWILSYADMQPGFLIGGLANNLGISSDLGKSDFFVIEADEYDSAFFDKRSKFVHYHPRTLVLNNLEFDHADIFENIAAIQKQFHHLIRCIPSGGLIIDHAADQNLQQAIDQGCWTPRQSLGIDWQVEVLKRDSSQFDVYFQDELQGQVNWRLIGEHNVNNALAAIAAARHVGVQPQIAIKALDQFAGIKRRLEIRGQVNNVTVYDDFAHHPTAIETTLKGLRHHVNGQGRILAVVEPRSNTMRMGENKKHLQQALDQADEIFVYEPQGLNWDMHAHLSRQQSPLTICQNIEQLLEKIKHSAKPHDHVVIMSNGGFDNIHQRLVAMLVDGE